MAAIASANSEAIDMKIIFVCLLKRMEIGLIKQEIDVIIKIIRVHIFA